MNFLEKIDYMMKKLGINKSKLSQLSGVPYTTIDAFYKKGYENTKMSTIRKLADALEVSLDYLIVDTITDENYGKTDGFKVACDEMSIIKKYRVLDEHGKEMVVSVLDIEARRCEEILARRQAEEEAAVGYDFPDSQSENTIDIMFCPQLISAGYGEWELESDSYKINVPRTPMTLRADFCARVSGDSMEPKFSDGDMIFVKKQDDVEVGEYGVWIVDGYAYLKKRGEDTLISLNPDYEDIEQGDYVYCQGKVLGKM